MKAVLLAAGRGNRLRPMTDTIPKPLIPMGGRPILQWILEGLRDAGIRDITIITGYRGQQIRSAFHDGSRFSLRLHYQEQTVQDGTARAILPAEATLRESPFFLGYGDIFVPPGNYRDMMDRFVRQPGDSFLGVWEVDDPSSGGAVAVRDGRLAGLVEKPGPGQAPSNYINAGLMILQPEIFSLIHGLSPSPRGEYELTDALLALSRQSELFVHPLREYWSDIGTPEKLAETDRWIRENLLNS